MFFVQDEFHANAYNVLAGSVVPEAAALTVAFGDGTRQVVHPVAGTFVLTYAAGQHVERVVPDLGSAGSVVCDRTEPLLSTPSGEEFLELSCHGSVKHRR